MEEGPQAPGRAQIITGLIATHQTSAVTNKHVKSLLFYSLTVHSVEAYFYMNLRSYSFNIVAIFFFLYQGIWDDSYLIFY